MTLLFSQASSTTGSGLAAFIPFILIGLIFYFFIIRPQSVEKKHQAAMLNNLKKDDKILTRGGLYGKIINFQGKNNEKVILEISPGVKINVARSYITCLSDKITK